MALTRGITLASVRGGMRGGRAARARGGTRALWALLSPRPLFSILVGFGAVGMILHPHRARALLCSRWPHWEGFSSSWVS